MTASAPGCRQLAAAHVDLLDLTPARQAGGSSGDLRAVAQQVADFDQHLLLRRALGPVRRFSAVSTMLRILFIPLTSRNTTQAMIRKLITAVMNDAVAEHRDAGGLGRGDRREAVGRERDEQVGEVDAAGDRGRSAG